MPASQFFAAYEHATRIQWERQAQFLRELCDVAAIPATVGTDYRKELVSMYQKRYMKDFGKERAFELSDPIALGFITSALTQKKRLGR